MNGHRQATSAGPKSADSVVAAKQPMSLADPTEPWWPKPGTIKGFRGHFDRCHLPESGESLRAPLEGPLPGQREGAQTSPWSTREQSLPDF